MVYTYLTFLIFKIYVQAVKEWCLKEEVSLVVVGPEDPLANGIADILGSAGIKCFGPSRLAARIEADKDWAKQFMDRHHIPTARWKGFNSAEEAIGFINRSLHVCNFVPKTCVVNLSLRVMADIIHQSSHSIK